MFVQSRRVLYLVDRAMHLLHSHRGWHLSCSSKLRRSSARRRTLSTSPTPPSRINWTTLWCHHILLWLFRDMTYREKFFNVLTGSLSFEGSNLKRNIFQRKYWPCCALTTPTDSKIAFWAIKVFQKKLKHFHISFWLLWFIFDYYDLMWI